MVDEKHTNLVLDAAFHDVSVPAVTNLLYDRVAHIPDDETTPEMNQRRSRIPFSEFPVDVNLHPFDVSTVLVS